VTDITGSCFIVVLSQSKDLHFAPRTPHAARRTPHAARRTPHAARELRP
jgi:hypothetical protein